MPNKMHCFLNSLSATALRKLATALIGRVLVGACTFAAVAAPAPALKTTATQAASIETRKILDWVNGSNDNHGLPFVIVDKKEAKVWVFGPEGVLVGVTPALMGSAQGDHSVTGIGERALSTILPEERTTPAGRFVAELGVNFAGEDIVWVDYDAAVSLHRVRTNNPKERRLERLASPTPTDNRISYGCINVPRAFYDKVVRPAFSGGSGIVYVLPEVRTLNQVFGAALP